MTNTKDKSVLRWLVYTTRYISIKEIGKFYLTITIPLFYLFCLYIIARFPHTISFPITYVYAGLLLSFVGIVFWFLSFIQLGKSFGVLPQKQKRIRRGIYRYLKHPMYVGMSLTYVGLGLANQSQQGLFVTLLLLIPLLVLRASLEENKLS